MIARKYIEIKSWRRRHARRKRVEFVCSACLERLLDGDYVRSVWRVQLEHRKGTVLEVRVEHVCCPEIHYS